MLRKMSPRRSARRRSLFLRSAVPIQGRCPVRNRDRDVSPLPARSVSLPFPVRGSLFFQCKRVFRLPVPDGSAPRGSVPVSEWLPFQSTGLPEFPRRYSPWCHTALLSFSHVQDGLRSMLLPQDSQSYESCSSDKYHWSLRSRQRRLSFFSFLLFPFVKIPFTLCFLILFW